jgi:hypothetical protein
MTRNKASEQEESGRPSPGGVRIPLSPLLAISSHGGLIWLRS